MPKAKMVKDEDDLQDDSLEDGAEALEGDEGLYDEDLKPRRSAFRNSQEAWELAKTFDEENKSREARDNKLYELYWHKPPYTKEELKKTGYDWVSNVSTGLLAATCESIRGPFRKITSTPKYLTSSRLRKNPNERLTTVFQEGVTKLIRSWTGFYPLMDAINQDNILLGRAWASAVDEFDFKFKFYGANDVLVPPDSPQDIDLVPVVVRRDKWLPHELLSIVQDVETAEANGWDVENVAKALNSAQESGNLSSRYSSDDPYTGDIHRHLAEGSYSDSYNGKEGLNYIETYTIFAKEPDKEGRISEWMVSRRDGIKLFHKKDRYDKMSDVVIPFLYSQGNSTIQSSRGMGRLVGNLHVAYTRIFNKVLDMIFLSSTRVVHTTQRLKQAAKVFIDGLNIVYPEGQKSEATNFSSSADLLAYADRHIVSAVRQIAGPYSPTTLLPDRQVEKTATEATIDAAREAELREDILGRNSFQFGLLVAAMIRRVLNTDTYVEEALEFQEALRAEGFTDEDLEDLREQSPLDHISHYSAVRRKAQIQSFCTMMYGDKVRGTAYDQSKLAYYLVEGVVDEEFAKEVTIVQRDPSVDSVAIHESRAETILILSSGMPLPVNPLSNDAIHIMEIMESVMAFMQKEGVMPTPKNINALLSIQAHLQAHIDQGLEKGTLPGQLVQQANNYITEITNQIAAYGNAINRLGQTVAEGLSQANGLPPNIVSDGSPPAAAEPGGVGQIQDGGLPVPGQGGGVPAGVG